MKAEEYKWGLKELFPSELRTDDRYQRCINASHVKKIVSEFNINKVDAPKVNLRDDGHYYIMDGDHTVTAWKQVCGNKPILCRVYNGLTWEEEADFFLGQIGIHKPIAATAKIRALKNLGDEDVIRMCRIAEEEGITVCFTLYKCDYKCCAVDALFKVYKRVGPIVFRDIMKVLVKSWNGDSRSLNSGFIQGLGKFFELYNGRFEIKNLVDSLKINSSIYYEREAKAQLSGTTATKYCRVFLKAYNKRRSSNRLPDIC